MLEPIKKIFRRRKIRKLSRAVPTRLIPLAEISTVNVVIDVEDSEWDLLKDDILTWGKNNGLKIGLYFFDFRKLGKDELLLTSIQTTVTRKSLNWIGMPAYETIAGLIEEPCDLFISLIDNGEFPIDFISKCSCARFKIGRYAYQGHVFNMIFSGRHTDRLSNGGRKVFAGIVEFLGKISK